MMPTFPRSPLSFRTAGFPQYGWKAGFPSGAFLDRQQLKPAPGMRALETDWPAGAAGFEPLHLESEFAKTLSPGAGLELAHLESKMLELHFIQKTQAPD